MDFLKDIHPAVPVAAAALVGGGGAYYMMAPTTRNDFEVPPSKYEVVDLSDKRSTIVQKFFEVCKQEGEETAYYYKELINEDEEGDKWEEVSFNTYAKDCKNVAKALRELNDKNRETNTISLWGDNFPEYNTTFFGGLTAKNIVSGIYSTTSAEQLVHVLNHSDTEILFLEKRDNLNKLRQVIEQVKTVKYVVIFNEFLTKATNMNEFDKYGIKMMSYKEFYNIGKDKEDQLYLPDLKTAYSLDDVAIYIFSSGTTGPPKCVMLTHKNIYYMASTLDSLTLSNPYWDSLRNGKHSLISYLPPCHIAEIILSMLMVGINAIRVYFLRNRKKLLDTLKEVRPTVFMSVPRGWSKIEAGLSAKFAEATGVKKKLLDWARTTALHYHTQKNSKKGSISNYDEMAMNVARKLIFNKIKKAIGLDRVGGFISGAAPLSKDLADFFMSLDIDIHEAYGQSEGTGICATNFYLGIRNGTVGWPLPGLDIRIDDDDEILIKGPSVFKGYYKDEELTKETIDEDGYLHSGDLGKIDEDGFLSIIGRKKDILITNGGKNITPSNIEQSIKRSHSLVGDAVLVADGRTYVTAIVSLDREALLQKYDQDEKKVDAAYTDKSLYNEIDKAIKKVNEGLNQVEKVKKFIVASRSFSVDDGELTPTQKIKRSVVYKHFADEIDSMYKS